MEKICTVSKEVTLIKSTVDNASKITFGIDSNEHANQQIGLKGELKTIQDEKDIQMEVGDDIEKEYDVFESI